jgi:hypothetical protein
MGWWAPRAGCTSRKTTEWCRSTADDSGCGAMADAHPAGSSVLGRGRRPMATHHPTGTIVRRPRCRDSRESTGPHQPEGDLALGGDALGGEGLPEPHHRLLGVIPEVRARVRGHRDGRTGTAPVLGTRDSALIAVLVASLKNPRWATRQISSSRMGCCNEHPHPSQFRSLMNVAAMIEMGPVSRASRTGSLRCASMRPERSGSLVA